MEQIVLKCLKCGKNFSKQKGFYQCEFAACSSKCIAELMEAKKATEEKKDEGKTFGAFSMSCGGGGFAF